MDFFPTNFMLQTPQSADDHHHHQPSTTLSPLFPSQTFHGGGKRSIKYCEEALLLSEVEVSENEEEGSQAGENNKKRRLNTEQVKALEKSFEVGNKLDPERKMQLARALGLQPRQIAIWFQNRRARWKTKQLERDYDSLKTQFDSLKAQNHALLANNQKLHAQIMALKNSSIHHHHEEPTESINLNKETDQAAGSCSNRSENSTEIKLHNNSSRLHSSSDIIHHLTHNTVKEEMSLSNIFCTSTTAHDDHSAGFWPTWLDNQHHFS